MDSSAWKGALNSNARVFWWMWPGMVMSCNHLRKNSVSVVGWAKQSVPNSPTSEREMLGTLRFAQPTQLSGQAALAWQRKQTQNKKCQEFLAGSTDPCRVSMWVG